MQNFDTFFPQIVVIKIINVYASSQIEKFDDSKSIQEMRFKCLIKVFKESEFYLLCFSAMT
jgi:hypothetical protein